MKSLELEVREGQEGKKTRAHTAQGKQEGTGRGRRTGNQDHEGRKSQEVSRLGKLDPGLISRCVAHPCAHAQNNT